MAWDDDEDDVFQFDGDWQFVHQTEKAVLIREAGIAKSAAENGVNQFWIPRSVLEHMDMTVIGEVGTVQVKLLWAIEQELYEE